MSSISRVEILIQQHKFELAEKEMGVYLAQNPNDGIAYSLSALISINQNKNEQAIEAAQKAVGLEPTISYTHYVLAKCYLHIDSNKKAIVSIQEALKIEPDSEHYLTLYAALLNDSDKKEEALDAIEKALYINPEYDESKRIKSIILRRMGRYKEADAIATSALEKNPESPDAFAVKGWSLLDTGKTKESLEMFKKAVMLEPTNAYAKSGLVTALKAQNKLFNLFYQYYNWVGKLPSKTRFAFFIGIIILIRVLDRFKETQPHLAPFLHMIVSASVIFVFLVWTIDPIFNIFLRFNRYGKHALDKGQIIGTNVMTGLIILVAAQYILHLTWDTYPLSGALGGLFLSLIVASVFTKYKTKHYGKLLTFLIIISCIYLLSVATEIMGMHGLAYLLYMGVIGAVVVYSWVSQFIK